MTVAALGAGLLEREVERDRIAALLDEAADGMTNREIAQALFVTMKTVEFPLTQGYRKLDISLRAELATALVSRGTAP